ncbi:MAG: hypothetical protein WBA57_03425 [Elainellaceae cyanobacterium]
MNNVKPNIGNAFVGFYGSNRAYMFCWGSLVGDRPPTLFSRLAFSG